MKLQYIALIGILFLMLFSPALANGDESDEHLAVGEAEPHSNLPVDPLLLAQYAFVGVAILISISYVLRERLSNTHKKVFFGLIAVIVLAVTLYAGATTVYLNVISFSQGPVHWHADFEIHICGQKVTNLNQPVFPSNKIGTPTLHHHDDYRIHQEGLVIDQRDISLATFFKVIGGELTQDSITIPLNDGSTATYTNGMTCPDGKEATLKLAVMNGESAGQFIPQQDIPGYTLSPYFSTVIEGAQGDLLLLTFDGEDA
jgi:hypothetical protein